MTEDQTRGRSTEKFTYEFFTKEGYIRVTGVGSLRLEDVQEHMRIIHDHPLFRSGLDSLIDLTDATMEGDYEMARQLHSFVRSIQDVRGDCRWAFVVPWDLNFGLARMFATLADDLRIQMKAFRNIQEAEKWLKQS